MTSLLPLPVDSVAAALGTLDDARSLALLVGLSGLALPAAIVVLLARWRPGGGMARRPGRAAAARAAATLPAALYSVIAIEYAISDQGAPARARLARALGAPIVGALDRYRGDRLRYPESLSALVPLYLAPVDFRAAERSVLARPFELERAGEAFILRVRYGAPGEVPASCEFSSYTRRWRCSGPMGKE